MRTFGVKNIFRMRSYNASILSTVWKYGASVHGEIWIHKIFLFMRCAHHFSTPNIENIGLDARRLVVSIFNFKL